MSYEVFPTENFKKEAKKLIKKYPSLKNELLELTKILSENPTSGIKLTNDIYKIRISIKSKGKGKSGGARVITYVVTEKMEVYLLVIYDKSDFDSINLDMLRKIIDLLRNDFGN